jgi:NAD(P)H-nitrite reductase large subunit
MDKAAPDRSKISIQNDYELKYWARHFGVAQEDLRRAIEKVGNSAASVRKELQRTSCGGCRRLLGLVTQLLGFEHCFGFDPQIQNPNSKH